VTARRHIAVAAERLYECSFLIPVRRDRTLSDGKRHSRKEWLWLQDELFIFGGMTEASQLYRGSYTDPQTGQRVWDESRKFFVALARAQVDDLRRLLRQACGKFHQKCIYLSVAGRVEFVEGESDVRD
jgi:hypothetical protein